MQLTAKKKAISKEVIATAQDIKYARFLAGNDKTIRDRAIKSLRKWFEQRCKSQIPFNEADLMLIWKGLFYSMWMSDKPLIQEECAERISALIHSLDTQTGFQFFKTGMKTLANEWFGIDQWRNDKFLMFVRRLLRQTFTLLKKNNWELKLIKLFATTLEESVLNINKQVPLSLFMHFCDIYMPELAKISEGQLNANILNEFLQPFVKALSKCNDLRLINAIAENIFRYLMKQSDVGMDFDEKYEAWKNMGFPGGNINAMQRVQNDSDDENEEDSTQEESSEDEDSGETPLDPRAGRVDVVLPQIKFSCKNVNALLSEHRFKAMNTKARTVIKKLEEEFTALLGGDYPLGIKKVDLYDDDGSVSVKKSAKKLVKFENQLFGRNKDKETRKRKQVEDEDVPKNKIQKIEDVKNDKKQNKSDKNKENLEKVSKKELKLNKTLNKSEKVDKTSNKKEKIGKNEEKLGKSHEKLNKNQEKPNKDLKTLKNEQKPVKNNEKQSKKEVKLTKTLQNHEEADEKSTKNQEKLKKDLKTLKNQQTNKKQPKKQLKSTKTNQVDEEADEELKQLRKTLKATRNLTKQKEILTKRNENLKNKVRELEAQKLLAGEGFIRNSGTWLVTEPESDLESDDSFVISSVKSSKTSLQASSKVSPKKNGLQESPKSPKLSPKKNGLQDSPKSAPKSSPKKEKPVVSKSDKVSPKLSPKSEQTPIRLQKKSPKTSGVSSTPKTVSLSLKRSPSGGGSTSTPLKPLPGSPGMSPGMFKTGDWDADLEDGEMEFFIPSKKYLAKRKSTGGVGTDWLDKSLSIVKAKNRRRSADPGLLSKLKLSTGTPRSSKKVKIDLRLNQSQEVYEHHAQIRSSPGIPFDANRMPAKPVIKPNAVASPINPFYSKRRSGLQF